MAKAYPYIENFEKRAFGMFIHWGLYSALGRGEWVYSAEKMNMETYQTLASSFTAKEFDAEAIVLAAKAAGMGFFSGANSTGQALAHRPHSTQRFSSTTGRAKPSSSARMEMQP